MKKHNPTNRNRDSLDYMGVPDQPFHCSSNKPTFSPITQAVPEIWPKRWTEYSCHHGSVMKIHNPQIGIETPLILSMSLINHLIGAPMSLLSAKSNKQFLRYEPKAGDGGNN